MKTPFRFPILVLLLVALADWAPLQAQTIPPPREATATETSAGTSGTVFISPRRLANLTWSVSQGGTGAATLTGILKGNGTSPFSAVAAPTGAIVGDSDPQTLSNKNFIGTASAISASDIDWSLANTHTKTLAANTTFTFSNLTSGQTITVAVTNTASNYTVTWPTVSWSGGTPPTQTTGAKTDIYTFIRIGSTTYGSVVQNF